MISSDRRSQVFEKKKLCWPEFGPNGFFRFLLSLDHFFLEIAYDDSLRQYLTSSRGKTHEKKFGDQIWTKRAKIDPEIRFFAIFSSLV